MVGHLLVIAGTIAGVLAGVTAYSPRLTLPDAELEGLTLSQPAGRIVADPSPPRPIAPANTVLTPEVLALLRDSGVSRVRVKEFAPGRWSEAWVFVAGAVSLLAGGLLVRRSQRGASKGTAPTPGAASTDAALESLKGIRAAVSDLRRDLPGMPEIERCRAVIDRLGNVQRDAVPAFVGARPAILRELGMARFARVMDRFAAAERQVNRAWSAAADSTMDEVPTCLERADELLGATEDELRPLGAPRG